MAGYLPLLQSGLLVWLHTGCGCWRVHSRSSIAGITHVMTKYYFSYSVFFMGNVLLLQAALRFSPRFIFTRFTCNSVAVLIYCLCFGFISGVLWGSVRSHEFGAGFSVSGGVCVRPWSCYNNL